MAQDDHKQPGNEGNNDKYSEYRFKFEASDALLITVKSKETKRIFYGEFTKETLQAMKLTQSIPEIISMIKTAKSGVTQKISFDFKIGFSSSDKPKPNQLSPTYNGGDALFVIVSINEVWLNCDYVFKLKEQERNQTDIQDDLIEDLKEDVAAVKEAVNKPKSNPVAVWKCNTAATTVPWNIVHIAATLNGMAATADNNASIVIGIGGMYKVSTRFGFNVSWGGCLNHELQLNGNRIAFAITYHSHTNCFNEILRLNQGDKLQYVVNNIVNNGYWDRNCNNFTLEYLGNQ